MIKDIYYFAFGSNLNHYRLHQRIGDYHVYDIGYLINHRLVFNKRGGDKSGKCTVITSHSDKVWGAVCQISQEQKEKLDYYEGVGHGYDAIIKKIITSKHTIEAVLYQAQLDAMDDGLLSFDWYKQYVLTGAKFHQLPDEHIQIIENINTLTDNNHERVKLNRSILDGVYPKVSA